MRRGSYATLTLDVEESCHRRTDKPQPREDHPELSHGLMLKPVSIAKVCVRRGRDGREVSGTQGPGGEPKRGGGVHAEGSDRRERAESPEGPQSETAGLDSTRMSVQWLSTRPRSAGPSQAAGTAWETVSARLRQRPSRNRHSAPV